ncbi:MAG TPA: hypothetical protein VI756_19850, partial [Blastocatellia bacterium]
DYSVEDVQKALNLWYPRGLEMFGNEHGGETAVTFGFKDKTNGQAQSEYIDEVRGVINNVNAAIVVERVPGISRDDARQLLAEIEKTGDPKGGIKPEDIVYLPSPKFFRKRGPEEVVFKPFDIYGNKLTRDGRDFTPDEYLEFLGKILPGHYIGSREYDKFVNQMREYLAER